MKKVLFLANHFLTLYLFRCEFIKKLIEDGYEVYLAIPEDENGYFEKMGCHIVNVDVDRHGINPLVDFKLFLQYKKIMKNLSPDVVLSYTIKPNIYGGLASRLEKVPCIFNITGLGGGMDKNKIIKFIIKTLYRTALKNGECVFVQNRENMAFLKEYNIKYKKCVLLPGSGVNLDKFVPLNYPEGDTVEFYYIARVMKAKGIEEYLAAAKHFKEKGYDANFHIFGFCEDDYEDILRKLENENVIIYHGMCDNMAELQEKNHCTILPSYHEGMSNVLLETSACSRPSICSDIPGCNDIIDDSLSGFLFEAKSAESLILAIEKFLGLSKEERKQMGIAARKKVEENFDRNIVIDMYAKEIKRLAGDKK